MNSLHPRVGFAVFRALPPVASQCTIPTRTTIDVTDSQAMVGDGPAGAANTNETNRTPQGMSIDLGATLPIKCRKCGRALIVGKTICTGCASWWDEHPNETLLCAICCGDSHTDEMLPLLVPRYRPHKEMEP